MKICACVCHCEWACADGLQGRCKRLGGILVVVGLKASFSSRLWLCVFEAYMHVKCKCGLWQTNTIMLSGMHHGCSMCGSSILSSR